MTGSSGFAAKGTTLLWNNVPVLELTNIGIPIAEADDVDISNHDSAFDYEEKVPGVLRGGDFTVEGNLLLGDTDGQIAVLGDLQDRTSRAAIIVGPAGKYAFEFSAYPKQFKPSAPVTSKTGMMLSFKVTGKSTLRDTASDGLTTPFFALRDDGANAVTPSPAASGSIYNFAATLDSGDTAVAIQPTAAAGTIRVNGTTVVSGAWSDDIDVAAGTTRQVVVEVRETSKAGKIYRIYVTRPSA
jgi:hypothetical protein